MPFYNMSIVSVGLYFTDGSSRVSTLKDFFLFKEFFAIARKEKGNTK